MHRKQDERPARNINDGRSSVHRIDSSASPQRPVNQRQSGSTTTPVQTASFKNQNRYAHIAQNPKNPRLRLISLLVGVGIVAVLAIGIFTFVQSLPAAITFNGASLEVAGQKTLDDALNTGNFKPQPGNLMAVDGSVLEEGKGEPFHATVNGTVVTDLKTKLTSGDVVEIGDGKSLEEPSDTTEVAIPWDIESVGNGAIHLVEGEGKDGLKTTRIGKISGIVAEQVTQEPTNIVRRNVTPDVGADKVIALTFDDGPWSEQTGELLDVLAEHGVRATFFTVGNRIEQDNGASYVKRAADEGHQICTHTYDHASGSGQSVNLGYMTPEEQIAEIEKGYAAIEAVTDTKASRVIRTPGGNFGPEVVRNIAPYITAEIGWNIDSQDWRKSGVGTIVDELKSAWPGAIVLCHDGGGHRGQTIEALKKALPYLKEQGYRFVTMDELMQYPLS